MKLTLIRHAKSQVDPRVPITLWGLAADGIHAATTLSGQPLVRDIDVMYSSLQTKAIETMLLLAKPNVVPMRTSSGLAEISSFTNEYFGGLDYDYNLEQFFGGQLARIAGGETAAEALSRFRAALDGIMLAEPEAGNIGVVTHGAILTVFTAEIAGSRPIEVLPRIETPDVAVLDWQTKQFSVFWGNARGE